jgi:phosphohistidine swiveling domain-containing protein
MIREQGGLALAREGGAMAATEEVLGVFYGSEEFPIDWAEGERDLFWIYDDLHCPNPVSPMFFDLGGWWLTCDHMFRRFGTPFACDWIAKNINGYVYTAAVPCDSEIHAEATEYQARYVPRAPRDSSYAAQIGTYLEAVVPHYARNFLTWWRERLRPEIEHNFAYLDSFDYDGADLIALAILLEDAIDIHDRHWKIHWMLNFAQFSATSALNGCVADVRGESDPELISRLQSSVEDRNWDSIEDLWKLKEHLKQDDELRAAFSTEGTAADVLAALERTEVGRHFVQERLRPHQRAYGYKSIWSHEFAFKTWVEDPAPIIEALRGYLATDYDYPSNIASVREDLEKAKAEVLDGVEGTQRERLLAALEQSLTMNPLTPDHHFYIDQGTNARLRLVLIEIGRKLVACGTIDDPEDVMFLRYNELRLLMADQGAVDAREAIGKRRDEHEAAARRRPPSWVGTATKTALAFPYNALWGFPEKFYAGEPETTGEVRGLAASAGQIEGTARYVSSLDEFDQVREGEILVCRMTNPAWVVLFTKISGLVTEAGGTVSHPAVVAREFAIPAVVGATAAGERIRTGDRVRVNGTTGVVELLS